MVILQETFIGGVLAFLHYSVNDICGGGSSTGNTSTPLIPMYVLPKYRYLVYPYIASIIM